MLPQGWITNTDYIKDIYNLRNYLSRVKLNCDKFEQNNPSRQQIIEFINKEKDEFFNKLDAAFERFWLTVKDLPREPYKHHQIFIQKILMPYFATPPLNQRIHDKPLGYDGDYMMMNYYYQNGYDGNSVFDILMHRYTLHIPIAIATTQRFNYLYCLIKSAAFQNKGPIKITTIGCGSANEISAFIKNEPPRNITFNCIDSEQKAIEEIKTRISSISSHVINRYKFNLYNNNILKYIKTAKKDEALSRQNLIYSGGLFDYLVDKVAQKLIEVMYNSIEVNGAVVLSNFSKNVPSRAYMELIGEWYLILRDENEMLQLCSNLENKAKVDITRDKETGTLLYLTIKKTK